MEKIKGIDKEVEELVYLLNCIPGLRTVESCFGHGKHPCMIWLEFDSVESLNHFLWAGCHRYFLIRDCLDWQLVCDNCDTNFHDKEISLLLKTNTKDEAKNIELIDCLVKGLKELIDKLANGIKIYDKHDNLISWKIKQQSSTLKQLSIRRALERKIEEMGGKIEGAGSMLEAPFSMDFSFMMKGERYSVVITGLTDRKQTVSERE